MRKLNLATQVLIAFVIGTVLGIIFQKDILFLQPVGDIFLRLIQMIVVPLIFFSIIGGIANIGDIGKLRRIGSKVLGFYVITTILSTIIVPIWTWWKNNSITKHARKADEYLDRLKAGEE